MADGGGGGGDDGGGGGGGGGAGGSTAGRRRGGGVFFVISDFLSTSYAKFYPTKRKSVKNASDSSLKLISYSSTLMTNF